VETCNRIECCSSRRFGARAVRLFDTAIIRLPEACKKFMDPHSNNSTPHCSSIYPFNSATAFTQLSLLFQQWLITVCSSMALWCSAIPFLRARVDHPASGGRRSGGRKDGRSGGQTGGRSGEQSGGRSGELSGGRSGEQSGGWSGGQSGGRSGEQSGGWSGGQSGGRSGEQSGGRSGEQSGGRSAGWKGGWSGGRTQKRQR
jgi:hypothetical protein